MTMGDGQHGIGAARGRIVQLGAAGVLMGAAAGALIMQAPWQLQRVAGLQSTGNTAAVPGEANALYVELRNPASVSQTVVGASDAEVSIAPHASRWVKVTLGHDACVPSGRMIDIDEVDVRVRAASTTRTVRVPVDPAVRVTGSGADC